MKKASLILALLGALYLSFDFYVNVGYYGYKLNQNGFQGSAIKVWQLGASAGDDESIYRLGIAYWAGNDVEENYDKAFSLLKQVKYLDPKTVKFYEYALADIYIYKGNLAKAKEMLKVLCSKNLEEACTRLSQVAANEKV